MFEYMAAASTILDCIAPVKSTFFPKIDKLTSEIGTNLKKVNP